MLRRLLCVALLAGGCTGAPAATPIIVYVTSEARPSPTAAAQAAPTPLTTPHATAAPTATPTVTAAPTPRPTPVRATLRPQPTRATHQDIEVVEIGFSTYKGRYDDGQSMSWAVIVRNPNLNAIARDVQLSVEFVDASGELVETVNDSWAAILPGQTVALGDQAYYLSNEDLGDITDMEIQIFHSDDWEPFSGIAGTIEFESVRTRADSIGSIETSARMSSTFERDLDTPFVVAVYRRDGEIVGGAWTFAGYVPSGGHTGIEIFGPAFGTWTLRSCTRTSATSAFPTN